MSLFILEIMAYYVIRAVNAGGIHGVFCEILCGLWLCIAAIVQNFTA